MRVRYPELFNALAISLVFHIFSFQWKSPAGLMPDLPTWPLLLDESLGFIKHASVLYVIFSGTTFSDYRWWFLPGAAAVALGAMFKIQHWPGSNLIYFGGFGLLLLAYLVPFFRKPVKKPLDYMKLGWLVVFLASMIVTRSMGYVHQAVALGEVLVFAAMMLLFILDQRQPNEEEDTHPDLLDHM